MSKVETAEQLIASAHALFVEEEYAQALLKYNEAILLEDKNENYFAQRSFCHYKLDNFTEAMADAKKAVELDPSNAKAYLRKGMAAFSLEEFETAKEAFEKSQALAPAQSTKTWIRKCEAELETEKDDEDSGEDMKVAPPKQNQVQPIKSDGPPPLERDVPSNPKAPISEPKKESQPAQPKIEPKKSAVRYEWYQTETHITVSIYLKNVKNEDAKINVKPQTLEVEVKLPNSSEYQLAVDLSDKVIPEECVTNILGTKIEIKLKKSRPAKWPSLENSGSQVRSWDVVADEKKEKGLVYPSSSKHGVKDWDAITKAEPEEKLEGDAALNKVFADIYKGATDDQRRAMLKSFQESGGTVLSTNWDEVGKGEVKGQPPKGMEMKKWSDL